jgi:hypothetical protein
MLSAKQKLAIEVADVDRVKIDGLDVSKATQHQILQQLASDSSGADHQHTRIAKCSHGFITETALQRCIAFAPCTGRHFGLKFQSARKQGCSAHVRLHSHAGQPGRRRATAVFFFRESQIKRQCLVLSLLQLQFVVLDCFLVCSLG